MKGLLPMSLTPGRIAFCAYGVEGCIHRPVEDRMIAHGIEPFTCLPANLIVLAIEEKLDRPVELAEIKLVEGACQLLLVIFEKRPSLD
jgi:hypothetical protein